MLSFYQRRKKYKPKTYGQLVTLVMDTRLFKMTNTYFVY